MHFISHQPINFIDLSIIYGNKQCIEGFTTTVYSGTRIGIIGRNGSGKTSLIKVLAGFIEPNDGKVVISEDVIVSYIPQLIDDNTTLSGGQRFNQRLSQALAEHPNLLLLDEPTNHLDIDNGRALMGWLKRYMGTLIVVTHDTELLRNCVDVIWHVDNSGITIFNGKYDEYLVIQKQRQQDLMSRVKDLNYHKSQAHEKLMKEQERAKNSRRQGEKTKLAQYQK